MSLLVVVDWPVVTVDVYDVSSILAVLLGAIPLFAIEVYMIGLCTSMIAFWRIDFAFLKHQFTLPIQQTL